MKAQTVAVLVLGAIACALVAVLGFGHLDDNTAAWAALASCVSLIGGILVPSPGG